VDNVLVSRFPQPTVRLVSADVNRSVLLCEVIVAQVDNQLPIFQQRWQCLTTPLPGRSEESLT
jgi:hypothetical protein